MKKIDDKKIKGISIELDRSTKLNELDDTINEFRKKKGSSTQTLLNNIDVIILNKSENLVNLFVRRSFSEHLFSWINDSASRL